MILENFSLKAACAYFWWENWKKLNNGYHVNNSEKNAIRTKHIFVFTVWHEIFPGVNFHRLQIFLAFCWSTFLQISGMFLSCISRTVLVCNCTSRGCMFCLSEFTQHVTSCHNYEQKQGVILYPI